MSMTQPVIFGAVGTEGYSRTVNQLLLGTSAQRPELTRFAAVYVPDGMGNPEQRAALAAGGVTLCESYDELLAQPIDAVWLPVPIHLHKPFTIEALRRGKAVLCEKPTAGAIDDLDEMIEARDRSGKVALVAYHDIFAHSTMQLKRMLLEDDMGAVRSAVLIAGWPRSDLYFSRNQWAGAFKRDGRWVMDSPANNALAHYLNLALFLLGPTLYDAAAPAAIEAELYRVNPIENYDTAAMRLKLEHGPELLVALTHACQTLVNPILTISTENGSAEWSYHSVKVNVKGTETQFNHGGSQRREMIARFAHLVRDEPYENDIAVSTLESSRPHLITINGASEATPVVTIGPNYYLQTTEPEGETLRYVPHIEQLLSRCAREMKTFHELGNVPWAVKPGRKDLTGYNHFAGPAV